MAQSLFKGFEVEEEWQQIGYYGISARCVVLSDVYSAVGSDVYSAVGSDVNSAVE